MRNHSESIYVCTGIVVGDVILDGLGNTDHSFTGSHNFAVSTDGVGPIDGGYEPSLKRFDLWPCEIATQAGSLDWA